WPLLFRRACSRARFDPLFRLREMGAAVGGPRNDPGHTLQSDIGRNLGKTPIFSSRRRLFRTQGSQITDNSYPAGLDLLGMHFAEFRATLVGPAGQPHSGLVVAGRARLEPRHHAAFYEIDIAVPVHRMGLAHLVDA